MTSLAARLNRVSLILGVIAWLILFFAPPITIIPRLLLLAILVVVPLALSLIGASELIPVQLLAAAAAVVAFLLPAGDAAGGLTMGWLAFTGVAALWGLTRPRAHEWTNVAELCLTAGMLYLPVGGVWLVAARLGVGLLGFGEPLVSLTAVHFHYAGFAALVIAGLTGRALAALPKSPKRIYQLVAVGLIAGMALVAAGITVSPLLEVVAAVVFAASLIGLVALQVRCILPGVARLPQILFGGSALMAVIAMLAAVTYAVSEFTGGDLITLAQMLRVHGEVNALGFVLCNLLAWTVVHPAQPTAAISGSTQ